MGAITEPSQGSSILLYLRLQPAWLARLVAHRIMQSPVVDRSNKINMQISYIVIDTLAIFFMFHSLELVRFLFGLVLRNFESAELPGKFDKFDILH